MSLCVIFTCIFANCNASRNKLYLIEGWFFFKSNVKNLRNVEKCFMFDVSELCYYTTCDFPFAYIQELLYRGAF